MRSKLPFKRKLRFAFTIKSPLRLFFTIVLAVIAFSITGICLVFAFYDRELAEINSFADAADELLVVAKSENKAPVTYAEVKALGEEIGTGYGAIYYGTDVQFVDLDFGVLERIQETAHFNTTSKSISCFSLSFFREAAILAGGVPQAEDEIMISSCHATAILLARNFSQYDEIIGQKLTLSLKNRVTNEEREEFTISGIYDNAYCDGKVGILDLFHGDCNQSMLGGGTQSIYCGSIVLHETSFLRFSRDPDGFLAPNCYLFNGKDAAFRKNYLRVMGDSEKYELSAMTSIHEYAEEIQRVSKFFIAPAVFFSVYAVLMINRLANVSIQRKSNMTGILRALGCGSRDVMQIFLIENLSIGIVAGAISCGITAAIIPLLNQIVQVSLRTSVVYLFPHPLVFVLLMVLSVGASLLSPLVPIRRECKKYPIECLKS